MSDRLSRIGSKRLFVGLITGVSVLICLVLVIGWLVPYLGFSISPVFTYLTGGMILLIVFTIAWISFGMVLQILSGRDLVGTRKTKALAGKLFLPVSEVVARVLHIDQQKVRSSFIQVNNDMTIKAHKKYLPEQILILLPHCIQWSECPIRVSADLGRCKRCGKCNVGDLLNLAERYSVHIAIATGGTIARRIVVEKKPRMILAVACERDLASGIQDTHPLPVYGILNERPFGPCLNTRVSMQKIEEALNHFIKPEKLSTVSNIKKQENFS